jgi:hypothetical protein
MGMGCRNGVRALTLALVVGCSPAVRDSGEPGAGPPPAGGADAGAGFSLPPPAAPTPDPPGSAPPGDAVCAATRAEAAPVPVDLYIMEDQSGSMGLEGKWDAVSSALKSFVQLPAAQGMSVGLGFFPRAPGPVPAACAACADTDCLANCGCLSITCNARLCLCAQYSTSSCFSSDYSFPAVPIAALPGAARPIIEALVAVHPDGGTPTYAALEGAITYARDWAARTNRKVAIALATDGEPTNCGDNNVQSVSRLARAAAAQGLLTFVIGVGSQLENLNAIAAAGGTNRAYLVEGADVQTQFLAALQSIQGAAARLSCAYAIPAPPSGQTLDPTKVNVEVTAGSSTTTLGQVADRARCDARGGWHYDDPRAPTQIQLCDATCTSINSGAPAQVAVSFGCRTRRVD